MRFFAPLRMTASLNRAAVCVDPTQRKVRVEWGIRRAPLKSKSKNKSSGRGPAPHSLAPFQYAGWPASLHDHIRNEVAVRSMPGSVVL
jgi:hypothetical protein